MIATVLVGVILSIFLSTGSSVEGTGETLSRDITVLPTQGE